MTRAVAPAVVPVLEIGGTHVTAALVDAGARRVRAQTRSSIDADGSAAALLESFAAAARALQAGPDRTWGVALPGPFDYARGVGDFAGVAKFAALTGVRVGDELSARLDARAIRFVNDADAFAIGEAVLGGVAGRAAFLTLGTGIGSCFLDDGVPVHDAPGIPPGGRVHLLHHAGLPLEDVVSTRAIVRAHAEAGGARLDVRTIADRARHGDARAAAVFERAFVALGEALASALTAFDCRTLVVGGAISQAWDLVRPALAAGLSAAGAPARLDLRPARSHDSALLGAAVAAG